MADTNEIKEMADVIHHELFNFRRERCEKLAEKLHEAGFRKFSEVETEKEVTHE